MATHKIHSVSALESSFQVNFNLIKKFNDFADSQHKWALGYWIGSLMIIGSFLLPVTFLTVYTLGGPVIPFLALSMVSFFMSLITNMSGMGIRACMYTFAASILLHLMMLLSAFVGYYM